MELVVVVKPEIRNQDRGHLEGGVMVIDNTEASAFLLRGRTIKTVVLVDMLESNLVALLADSIRAGHARRTLEGNLDFMFPI